MSRYTTLVLEGVTTQELHSALDALGIPSQTDSEGERLMLADTLECSGQPVDVRIASGQLDTVDDFGFRVEAHGLELVCGEVDRGRLKRELVARLQQQIMHLRLQLRGINPVATTIGQRIIIEDDT